MNTFQLDCFLNVAETLSFARAAEAMNITQPAVTHQIHSLEGELNVKLFRRTTRTVELTSEGKIFLNDARNIVMISARAKKRFENPFEREMLLFSIGCHSYTHLFLLPDVLRELAVRFPHVHPRLRVVPFQHLYQLLEEEEVDGIIGFQESDMKKIPGTYKELTKVPIRCICSCDHPLADRLSVTPAELEQEKLILNDPMKVPARVACLQGQLMGGRPSSDFYFCESAEAETVLVQAGFGISILPELLIPPDPSIARIPVEGLEILSFGVYYKTLQGNAPLKEFVRIMKEKLQDSEPGREAGGRMAAGQFHE